MFENKSVIVIGGTGSFGQAITKAILNGYNPKVVRIFSRGEYLQQQMQQSFNNEKLRFFIGDIRDKDRLYRAMKDIDIVIYAAALKQVPTCEYCPDEAVKTNIDGTMNVIYAALENEVEKVIALSTDKASEPKTLYGATKLVMEKLIIQANVFSGTRRTRFACTRYGNIIASRGSVVPMFIEQKKTGELTITDERMTRFWLTLEQGVNFVIQSLGEMKMGEIFIPKIPSMKLIDMADAIAPEANKKIIGIRPGEKLHEILFTEEESLRIREFDDHFVIVPETLFINENVFKGGEPCSITSYRSDTNTQWLTKEDLRLMLKSIN